MSLGKQWASYICRCFYVFRTFTFSSGLSQHGPLFRKAMYMTGPTHRGLLLSRGAASRAIVYAAFLAALSFSAPEFSCVTASIVSKRNLVIKLCRKHATTVDGEWVLADDMHCVSWNYASCSCQPPPADAPEVLVEAPRAKLASS
eukprot:281117-Amphidinium_carterae.1